MKYFSDGLNKLQMQDRLAQTALDLCGAAVLLFDCKGILYGASQSLLEMTGYSAEQLYGMYTELFHATRFDQGFLAELLQNLSADNSWQGDVLIRHQDGSLFSGRLRLQAQNGAENGYIALVEDLSQRLHEEELIFQLRYSDTLTGLPNWAWLVRELSQCLALAHRHLPSLAIVRIDINRFKAINDALGEEVCDGLLAILGERLRAAQEPGWLVARRDGDEFCVVAPADDDAHARQIATMLLERIAQPIWLETQRYVLSACAGVSLCPRHGSDAMQLLGHAGTALHAAKYQSHGGVRFFNAALASKALSCRRIEDGLQQAIEHEAFFLCYQPKINLNDHSISGVEALLRWRLPNGELVPPDVFIPIAEQSGQIVAIGRWVLHQACWQGKRWHESGRPDLHVAVNLSPCQFRQDDLVQMVETILTETGFAPQFLELEITESALMEDPLRAEALMTDLHRLGVNFSVDDFGTGYSSLAYLKRFSLQQLKIDRTFIADCFTDQKDRAIIASIIDLAHHLGLQVVAEGVESEAQLHYLRELCCGQAQGFLFSPPLSALEFDAWLNTVPLPGSNAGREDLE